MENFAGRGCKLLATTQISRADKLPLGNWRRGHCIDLVDTYKSGCQSCPCHIRLPVAQIEIERADCSAGRRRRNSRCRYRVGPAEAGRIQNCGLTANYRINLPKILVEHEWMPVLIRKHGRPIWIDRKAVTLSLINN